MCGIGEMAISGHCWVCSDVLRKPIGGEALPGTAAQPPRTRCLFLDRHLQRMQKYSLENVAKSPLILVAWQMQKRVLYGRAPQCAQWYQYYELITSYLYKDSLKYLYGLLSSCKPARNSQVSLNTERWKKKNIVSKTTPYVSIESRSSNTSSISLRADSHPVTNYPRYRPSILRLSISAFTNPSAQPKASSAFLASFFFYNSKLLLRPPLAQ